MNIFNNFKERLPHRPYCTDDLDYGLCVRGVETALNKKYIQLNSPKEISWLIFDIDRPGAAWAWEWSVLPPPTFSVINPRNGHAHLLYGLNTPVALSDLARNAPIRYAAAIEAAFGLALDSDPRYGGLMVKNPLHPHWKLISRDVSYDLGELAEYVDLNRTVRPPHTTGIGRNCTLFDNVRDWAYRNVLAYKRNGARMSDWFEMVLAISEKLNVFLMPLNFSEVRSIAKSIAKWTWRQFTDATFSEIQSQRGKRGGRPATTTKNGKPWEAAGISKATYYRRRLEGGIIGLM